MPKGSDWFNFIYVNLSFLALIFAIALYRQIQKIKKNWPVYRCNPMYMPFADNIPENFAYCVQNMQSEYMGYILKPIWWLLDSVQGLSVNVLGSLQDFRKMIAYIRFGFGDIITSFMAIFANLIIQFQKVMIGMKDSVAKMGGILVSFLYIMSGVRMTAVSIWEGPTGQMTRALCFQKDTMVMLKNNKKVCMKDISLGDILHNGSKVLGVMQVANENNEPFYKFKCKDTTENVEQEYIFVTSTHYVFDEFSKKYVMAKEHPDAILTDRTESVLSCLITDDHKISIGGLTFWDWEDDLLTK
jgi:hypothetical protein